MHHTVHTLDITLLRDNKDEFILRCQRIVIIVVKHFIKHGLFSPRNIHDIIQSVNEELIKRLPGVERNYNGKVLMVTYMNVVIRNICLDLYHSERRSLDTIPLESHEHPIDESEIFRSLNISDELDRFTKTLKLYHHQMPKIIVCLKIYFRLPISHEEIIACFPWSDDHGKESIVELMKDIDDDTLEIDNFNLITPLINRREGKTISGDSLRRWTQEHLYKIIAIMNGKSVYRSHSKETIKTLLEHYSFGKENL